jgi:YVTN family beta-propeller protein
MANPGKMSFMKQSFLFCLLTIILVCRAPALGRSALPYDRMMRPAGKQIYFGDSSLENHALACALSFDGKWLAVEERYSIVFISTLDNEIRFTLRLKESEHLKDAMNTYSGICWHTINGRDFVFWSAANKKGFSCVARASWDGKKAEFGPCFVYKPNPPAVVALPNQILIRKESGKDFLYVALNGNNQLVKQDFVSGDTVWVAKTGVAPYGLREANGKLYVTNWGGRLPEPGDSNVAGVPWGKARIDSSNAAVREGSVSVFDPATGRLLKETGAGLHPNEIVASPDGRFVYSTNSNSDKVSVINTVNDEVTETISTRLQESMNRYFGDSPDGLAISADGKILYVADGMDNAVAEIDLDKKASSAGTAGKSSIRGFIPTEAYPSSISILNDRRLYVTNLEAETASLQTVEKKSHVKAYNSHHMLASVSVIETPSRKQLTAYTKTVVAVNQLSRLKSAQMAPRKNAAPRPVPERIGEPSPIKHVLYIIRENRTYDQVLGDMAGADGDSSLCIFGKNVTPNAHALAKEYMVLDNFMASGKCSAEGHQWTDASIVTDYIEKNVRAWFRSYPHIQTDALVYAPSGFLWDNARKHGKKVRIYGEGATPIFDKSLDWKAIYSAFTKGDAFSFHNVTTLNTLKNFLSPSYPAFDHKIPDVLKAKAFIDELKETESLQGDQLPDFMIMALPNDHTMGTRPGYPTPRAQVADNDLALGRIVDAVSHSRFWNSTAILVVEDDSQDGWDHVSAYRTVALVISPYSKLQKTIHVYYDQPCMVRTIEQILGLPPMNIQDAIASPMFSCFTSRADTGSYQAIANTIPLDEMNPDLINLHGSALHYAKMSLTPQYDGLDSGDDNLLNHILWNAAKGSAPYPEKQMADADEK